MLLLLVCVSHSFTLVYLFLCCVHSPVASWHQVGGKRQDAVQSQDSRSINHICTGTAGLLFLFKYWGGYTAGVPKCSTGGHRRAWFVRKCFLKGTTEQKLKHFFSAWWDRKPGLLWIQRLDLGNGLPGLMTQSVSFYDVMCLPQDLYLHKFFQHCQLMTSEGNPAELIRYLKVPFLLI